MCSAEANESDAVPSQAGNREIASLSLYNTIILSDLLHFRGGIKIMRKFEFLFYCVFWFPYLPIISPCLCFFLVVYFFPGWEKLLQKKECGQFLLGI